MTQYATHKRTAEGKRTTLTRRAARIAKKGAAYRGHGGMGK